MAPAAMQGVNISKSTQFRDHTLIMVCTRCPFYERNGGTLQQRQEHCPSCQLEEPFPKPYYPIAPGETLTDAVIEKASLVKYQEEAEDEDEAGAAPEAIPTVSPAFVEEVAKSEFVQRFSRLGWRTQATLLGILKHGDCTQCVADMTHFAVSTIWEHRRKLEADAFWKQFIRISGGRLHTRNRKPRGTPGRKRPRRTRDCDGALRPVGTATVGTAGRRSASC